MMVVRWRGGKMGGGDGGDGGGGGGGDGMGWVVSYFRQRSTTLHAQIPCTKRISSER